MALKHPQSHDHGDGDRHADSENAPRAIRERIHHHDAKACQRDQKNKEHRDHRHQPGKRTDFGAGNIRQRSTAMTHRSYQHGEVLHTTRKHAANQNPKKARRESKLRRQSRADQRSRSGDGCEVMAEEHPLRRSDVVMSVGIKVRGSGAPIIQRQSLRRNERTVITVGNRIHTQRTQQNRESIHASLQAHEVAADAAGRFDRILHLLRNSAQLFPGIRQRRAQFSPTEDRRCLQLRMYH